MTNYNFCGAETTIDYAYHSPELKVTLEVFDHSSFPLNTSSHIPILYTPEYNKEIHNENFTEESESYIPDPSLPKRIQAPIFIPHKKIIPDLFDKELYRHKSLIYILTAYKYMEDMNSCEKLSIIAQLLAFSADRCTLKPPVITNYDKEITKNTRYFDKKLKFTKK